MIKKIAKAFITRAFENNPRVQALFFETLRAQGLHFFKILDDHQIVFYPDDTIGRSIRQTGAYDRGAVSDLKTQLEALGKPVRDISILEIGANIGTHTILSLIHI